MIQRERVSAYPDDKGKLWRTLGECLTANQEYVQEERERLAREVRVAGIKAITKWIVSIIPDRGSIPYADYRIIFAPSAEELYDAGFRIKS